jgi:hypothetical protein
MHEYEPVPEPSGSLQPPRRDPPTAVGAAAPEPQPPRRPVPSVPNRKSVLAVAATLLAIPPLLLLRGLYRGVEVSRRAVRHVSHRKP